jgi:flagellar motor switch/type III secretory pathway protein FliN
MTIETRLWLPPSALSQSDEDTAVRRIVNLWASDWLGAACPSPQTKRIVDEKQKVSSWRRSGNAWLGQSEADKAKLGSALCAGSANIANPRDRTVLAMLAERAGDDLAALFSPKADVAPGAKSSPPPQRVRARYEVQSNVGQWSLQLVLMQEEVIAARRLASPPDTRPDLGTLSQALAGIECALSVHLGQAQLTTAELGSLEIGDVIAFDRAWTEGAPLLIAGKSIERSLVRIAALDRDLKLIIDSQPLAASPEL